MKYSIDASALIGGWGRHYPHDVFPLVWAKMQVLIECGDLRATELVLHELSKKDDELLEWTKSQENLYVPVDEGIQEAVKRILAHHDELFELAKNRSGADPFVIALAETNGCAVVSEEKRAPKGKQPHIPDVCTALGIRHLSLLELFREERWRFD